ncbi:hypothetical protein P9112_007932 [Eukaryota sp. TZLM1-RC]
MPRGRHFFSSEEDDLILTYIEQKLTRVGGDLDALKLGGNIFWQHAIDHFHRNSQLLPHTFQSIRDRYHKYLKKTFLHTMERPSVIQPPTKIQRPRSPQLTEEEAAETSAFLEMAENLDNHADQPDDTHVTPPLDLIEQPIPPTQEPSSTIDFFSEIPDSFVDTVLMRAIRDSFISRLNPEYLRSLQNTLSKSEYRNFYTRMRKEFLEDPIKNCRKR